MSAENFSNISAAFAQTFASKLTRAWNRSVLLAKNVPVTYAGVQGMGQNVAWDVEFSGATAASFAEGADVSGSEYSYDPVTKATLTWGQYRSAFSLSNLEINIARANMGNAAALEDIIGERFLGAVTKIADSIEGDMFSGTGTDGSGNPTIIGLDTALAATGSYAGINKSTYSEWAGVVSANGGTSRALTMNLLATTEQAQFIASGMESDGLVTTAGIHTSYEGLFEATRRTVDSGQGPIPSYQGSTGRLFWRGKPVMRARKATSGNIYGLNFSELEFCVLPFAPLPEGVPQSNRTLQDGTESLAIPCNVYPLARTGSAVKFAVEVYCQLKVKRPNAHFLVKDVA